MTGPLLLVLAALGIAFVALWWQERRRNKQLRRQIEAQRQRADTAGQAGDAFFDFVSHELRSPIAAIIGYDELLRDGAYGMLGDGAEEPLHRIGRSARYLLHLIDGTVDLARQRVGDLTPRIEPVALHDLIDNAVQTFRTHAEERALEYSTRVDPDIPDIRSDLERLPRALDLMLFSAVKHPGNSGVDLRVEREDDGATVRVTGVRLPFHPEADDPVLRTGIRIGIVAATARLLGGELRVESDTPDAATALTLRIRDVKAL